MLTRIVMTENGSPHVTVEGSEAPENVAHKYQEVCKILSPESDKKTTKKEKEEQQ